MRAVGAESALAAAVGDIQAAPRWTRKEVQEGPPQARPMGSLYMKQRD